MKEAGTVHWTSPNTRASNSSGFTGLPGCKRDDQGVFSSVFGNYGFWWPSTSFDPDYAGVRVLNYNNVLMCTF